MSYEFKSTIDGFKSTSCEFKSTSYEFKFTKEAPIQSITDIALLGFSLILLPGMFISYCTIIYFFVYIYIYIFSNVYISVNTIFQCSCLSFGWEIGHPLSMYAARGMEVVIQKGERDITLHVYVRTYTISFHVFVIWYLVLFVVIWICVILFNTYVQLFLKKFFGTTLRRKQLL